MAAMEVGFNLRLIIQIILDLQYFTKAIGCDCYPDLGIYTGSEALELLRHSVFRNLYQGDLFSEADFVKWNHHIVV